MNFSSLPYKEIATETLLDGRNKTTMTFDKNRMLMVTDMKDDENVVFSFFIDRRMIAANVMNGNEFITAMENYFCTDSTCNATR